MRPTVKKRLILAAAASTGLLGIVGYPAIKTVYPIKKQATIIDDYVDIPTATADLTKDIVVPEGLGAGTEVPIDISHWLLLSMLKSSNELRRERALNELARQRKWNDAECLEIAQALDRQDIIKIARTVDADIRLFLPPPSIKFIQSTMRSEKIDKIVKTILKDLSESGDSCSSCTNFYTNLSIRVRPDSNILAMSDLDQVDKMMMIESRKRKKSAYNEDVIRLKAVLNNIICGESQAFKMAESGILLALLYFRHKYKDDLQINSLLSQILANLAFNDSTREYLYTDGWIQTLTEYTRSEHLELSMPAFKALANLDEDVAKVNGRYGNHIYLLSPVYRKEQKNNNNEPKFDVIFVHGLVGSVFKTWRQGSIVIDEYGNKTSPLTPTTELLLGGPPESFPEEQQQNGNSNDNNRTTSTNTIQTTKPDSNNSIPAYTRCWPKDWLPEDVSGLRVLAVDYPTALTNWRTECDLNKDSLRERANHVMKQLEAANIGNRPIIWIAHSMGGLLVKQILVICDEALNSEKQKQSAKTKEIGGSSDKENIKNISGLSLTGNNSIATGNGGPSSSKKFKENVLKQTNGIVFYSVPHRGSNLDWIERRNLQKLMMLTTEVIELQKDSPILIDLHEKFLKLIGSKYNNPDQKNIKFLSFVENSISIFGVNKVVQWKGVLVHEDSLMFEIGPNIKLNTDHANTCKPHGKDAITYQKTLDFIHSIVPTTTAPPKDEQLLPFISFIL